MTKFFESLYRYAKSHRLEDEAHFEENEVEWLFCVGKDGSLSLERQSGPRANRGRPFHLPIPFKRSSGIMPNFPADFPLYVLGLDPPEKNKRERRQKDWPRRCHEAYLIQLERAAKETGDSVLALVSTALRRRFPDLALDSKIKGAGVRAIDTICPAVMKDGEWWPIGLHPPLREWWVRNYATLQRMEAGIGTCGVTGAKDVPIARIHPLVTGIRGGRGTGLTLVTFNDPSSESFGQEQGMNATISVDAAILVAKALSRICSAKSGKRRSIQVEEGLHMGFIPQKQDEEEAADFVLSLLDPIENDFSTEPGNDGYAHREVRVWRAHRTLFGDPRRGVTSPAPGTPVDFFLLRVRESSSRIEVLRHEVETYAELARHLRAYFADLETYDPWEKRIRSDFPTRTIWPVQNGGEKKRQPVARGLMNALREGPRDLGPRPEVVAAYYTAALSSGPIPPEILGLAVAAAARSARKGYGVPAEVCALLKITLNRELRRPGSHLRVRWNGSENHFQGVQPMLDRECKLVPYIHGRTLAIAERFQEIAIPKVIASVVKRLYDGLMKSPASFMPGLLSGMNHHIAKIKRVKPGLAVWCHRLRGEVLDLLPADKDMAFPRAFDLPEQALFGLGYAHQRSDLFRKREEEPEPAKI